ncbi:MAG: MATE family efflux transporter [Bacteroidetes bacterium]|nr:MATE family efflux transporter [Bacteroidota bacterium]MBU1578382.1 MATE family efflux transporter [Bacteroidota bacterium]MBU2466904.1 MATE family efflux transporter [Bacteroidota bacterium]MBU2558911.1 MATE family efflux transporter [Bacteroidota bacterium]
MRDLTTGNEGKLILAFTIPMLIGNVFQQLYNIVDSIIIGRYLGNEALAAVGASFPLIFTLISLIIGIATGTTIIIAQYYGAKNIGKVQQAIETMYLFIFVASIFLSLIGIYTSTAIFKLIDLPEEVIPEAVKYFNIYALGFVFFFGFQGTSAILRGLGDSKTPLYFLIVATMMNIMLDLLFVVVFEWGIEGVAYATIISQAGAFISIIYYLNRFHKVIRFNMLRLRFNREIFFKSIKIGLPTGFQQTFVAVGMLALYKVVNMFGTTVIAAYAVAMRIDSFAALPAMNFSAALSSFVGQNIGAKKLERVRSGMLATLRMTSLISLGVTIVAWIFAEQIMQVFTTDQAVVEAGKDYLYIVSAFYILFSAMFVMNGVLRGAGDTLIPMFITIFALWVIRIPASWFLAQHFGPKGIWWGIPVAWGIGAVFSYIYYRTGRWRTKSVVKQQNS